MVASNEKNDKNVSSGSDITKESNGKAKLNRKAPAGSDASLGAESVRDGRPSTDDTTVEAIDEAGPEDVL